MADNKRGRDKQAHDADRRRRERYMAADLERGDEAEPPVGESAFGDLDTELESLDYPVPASEAVTAVGSHEIDSDEGAYTVADVLPETDAVTFDEPAEVRVPIQRPTIAAAMKRIVEATETVPHVELTGSQLEAYEKTFRALKAIDADDDDEGIQAIGNWIVERIHEKETLPGSRDVRRQAATFCRENGYEVRNDEWLGV